MQAVAIAARTHALSRRKVSHPAFASSMVHYRHEELKALHLRGDAQHVKLSLTSEGCVRRANIRPFRAPLAIGRVKQ